MPLNKNATSTEILNFLKSMCGVNNKVDLINQLGSPNTSTSTFDDIVSNIKNLKNKFVTNLGNKGITANNTDSLDSLVTKVNNIARGQGNAIESDVLKGKTFTNSDGVLRTGNIDLTNLKPENIKKDININGTVGTLDDLSTAIIQLNNLQPAYKTIYPTPNEFTITASGDITSVKLDKNGDIIYASNGTLNKINSSGQNLWATNIDAIKIDIDNSNNIYVAGNNSLYKLNSSGQIMWHNTTNTFETPTAIFYDSISGNVYIGTYSCIKVYCFNNLNGEFKWVYNDNISSNMSGLVRCVSGIKVLSTGEVIVGSSGNSNCCLYKLNKDTGECINYKNANSYDIVFDIYNDNIYALRRPDSSSNIYTIEKYAPNFSTYYADILSNVVENDRLNKLNDLILVNNNSLLFTNKYGIQYIDPEYNKNFSFTVSRFQYFIPDAKNLCFNGNNIIYCSVNNILYKKILHKTTDILKIDDITGHGTILKAVMDEECKYCYTIVTDTYLSKYYVRKYDYINKSLLWSKEYKTDYNILFLNKNNIYVRILENSKRYLIRLDLEGNELSRVELMPSTYNFEISENCDDYGNIYIAVRNNIRKYDYQLNLLSEFECGGVSFSGSDHHGFYIDHNGDYIIGVGGYVRKYDKTTLQQIWSVTLNTYYVTIYINDKDKTDNNIYVLYDGETTYGADRFTIISPSGEKSNITSGIMKNGVISEYVRSLKFLNKDIICMTGTGMNGDNATFLIIDKNNFNKIIHCYSKKPIVGVDKNLNIYVCQNGLTDKYLDETGYSYITKLTGSGNPYEEFLGYKIIK